MPAYNENTFEECNGISSCDIEKSQSIVFVFVLRLFQQSYIGLVASCSKTECVVKADSRDSQVK